MSMSLDVFKDSTLLIVSKLKFNGGFAEAPGAHWLVDGETPAQRQFLALGSGCTRMTLTQAERFNLLEKILNGIQPALHAGKKSPLSELKYPSPSELITKAVAVAWMREYSQPVIARRKGKPYIKLQRYVPVFLSAFGRESAPDFFTSIKDAAAYVRKTKRTILNWKRRGWLKVEQNGKKIRIAKTDLDKCVSGQ